MKKQILLFIAFVPLFLYAQNHKIQGLIVDSINQTPVDYANIGIEGKNLGTVSNDSGEFELEMPDKYLNDSLTFSRIGYATKKIRVGELVLQEKPEMHLVPVSTEISEAKIVSAKLKRHTKGNKFRPRIMQFFYNFSSGSANLGYEVGSVINLPEKPAILKNFNFHIYNIGDDSVKLRLNIYDFNNGNIEDNLLEKNIWFVISKRDRGNYSVDLSDYQINVYGNILVTLENIATYTSDLQSPGKSNRWTIQFSASLSGSKGYRKKRSLASWEELPSKISPEFWVTILK